jgi:nicotinamide-nucleotide amidase
MALRAEIISIGDELTSGQRLDTNSQWISQQLGHLGISTAYHTTVGDSMADNVDAFRTAARRVDIVIASGGLGPTADDLTREAMSTAFEAPLEMRQEALDHIESLFALRKRPMPERNRVQAMFPTGSRIIDNPHGTAPGIDLEVTTSSNSNRGKCRLFALPGVPAEMKQMFAAIVEQRLREEMGVGEKRWFFHSLKVFGIGESDVEKRLPDLIHRDRDPIVGITVSKATITLRIAAVCSNEQEFQAKIQPTVQQIRSELGLLVFGEGEQDIDEATCELLASRDLKLGVIEVGSGVWIQQSLARLSRYDTHGIITSHWAASMGSLELPQAASHYNNLLNQSEADEITRQLGFAAEQLMNQANLDLCLAAGVYPTLESVAGALRVPTSDFRYVLARRGHKTKHTTLTSGAPPDVLYHRLAKAGINFLRLELLQHA